MKWFLIGSVCLFCSATMLRADDADVIVNTGDKSMQAEDYAAAAKSYDQVLKDYPNKPTIDDIRLKAGFAFFRAGDFKSAIDRLLKEVAPNAKPEIRPTALLYTGLAQLGLAGKLDGADKTATFTQAVKTFTDLIAAIKANPTQMNNDMLEDAIYYRVLAESNKQDYAGAIADLQTLVTNFSSSLRRPDYYLLMGSLYAAQASEASSAKPPKPPADVIALAQQALDALDHVSSDRNALVQANDANLRKGEVLYMIAPLMDGTTGYQKALAAFQLVARKDDMVPRQQERLDTLKKQAQDNAANAAVSAMLVNKNGMLIDREQTRLKELKDGPDPIIQALVRIAECYNSMKEGDEARTVLHRLAQVRPVLTPDQQQEVDFQLIYSYVLGGQSDKADAALTDYLTKHPDDKQAQGISYQMAVDMMKRKDFAGALAQATRSLKDFPSGPYAADAVTVKADALRGQGKLAEAEKVVDDFVAANPKSPTAWRMLLIKGQTQAGQGDLKGALAAYQKVKDSPDAGDLQPVAWAAEIQTLQQMKDFPSVLKESDAYLAKYGDSKAAPSVMTLRAVALDQSKQPGAVQALQDIAKKYPASEASSYALYYVITIYQRENNVPGLIQAAADLRAAYPEAYPMLLQAADAVSTVEIKVKKFAEAADEYSKLAGVPVADIAATAQNKIGDIWLQGAKGMGAYQSLQSKEAKDEATKRLTSAESAYQTTLKKFPDNIVAVGDAFEGLSKAALQSRSWGLVKDDGLEALLGTMTSELTTPEMLARVEMAKAGLVFVMKNPGNLFGAALDRFNKVVAANPSLALTRQEASQYGELLIASKDYPKAIGIFNTLLGQAGPTDQLTRADAEYGLGAAYLAQGDLTQAKTHFLNMKSLNGGALWHPHIIDANFGIALADEKSTAPADLEAAKQIYASLMTMPQASYPIQAQSMLGYGRLLEKAGFGTTPSTPGTQESGVHYYEQVNLLFGPAVPQQSAEGLYSAGQAYDKAGDKVKAKASYDALIKTYGTSAPDWAAKAKAAGGS